CCRRSYTICDRARATPSTITGAQPRSRHDGSRTASAWRPRGSSSRSAEYAAVLRRSLPDLVQDAAVLEAERALAMSPDHAAHAGKRQADADAAAARSAIRAHRSALAGTLR